MKPTSILSLLAAASAAHAQPAGSTSSTSVSTELKDGQGTVTITVEKDGKKETRTIAIHGDTDFKGLTDQIVEKLGSQPPVDPAAPPPKKVTFLGVMLSEPGGSGFGAGGGLSGGSGLVGGSAGDTGGGAADVASSGPGLPAGTGLTVTGVTAGSPAERAGLQGGDVLAKLNDQILVNPGQFTTLVRNMKEGDTVKISFIRNGEAKEVEASLASRVEESTSPAFNQLRFAGSLAPDTNLNHALRSADIEIGRVLTIDPLGNVIESTPGSLVPPAPPLPPGAPAPPPSPALPPAPGQPDPARLAPEFRPAWEKALREAASAKDQAASQWREQLSKWRAEWTDNQKQATEEYRKAMEKMGEELAKARGVAEKAREEARRAVEEVMRKIEEEKAKSAPQSEPKPEQPESGQPKNA